jgi:hypothetical protein
MSKFDVVEWMAEKAGKPAYRCEVNGWKVKLNNTDDPALIAKYSKEIETIYREAQDRYDDWVSDIYE